VMYYVNIFLVSLLNMLTLLFVIFRKGIKRKVLWIPGILLLNPTFFLSITDGCIARFFPLNGPVYLTHFHEYPFSLKIVIPLVSILFWCLYLWRRNMLMNDQN